MERSELEAAVVAGLSCRQLAEKFEFASSGAVQYWLRKYGLRTNSSRRRTYSYKFSDAEISFAVSGSTSMVGFLRYLGVSVDGGGHRHYWRRIKSLNLDTSHFIRTVSRGHSSVKKSAESILVVLPAGSLRVRRVQLYRAMLEVGFVEKCELCGLGVEWCGKLLNLEPDHIDGDPLNNLQENLRFLCPNCHSQTATFKNKKRMSL